MSDTGALLSRLATLVRLHGLIWRVTPAGEVETWTLAEYSALPLDEADASVWHLDEIAARAHAAHMRRTA